MKSATDTIQQALSGAGLNQPTAPSEHGAPLNGAARGIGTLHDNTDGTPIGPAAPVEPAHSGEFITRSFTNNAGTRTYKLYVPGSYSDDVGDPVPTVVMLHGCTQSPDDFAAGTRMNALAEQHGFLVVYPAQAANANGSKCWNWFRSEDQTRDRGEPSLIAGITREIASNYRVDERRIFVAGLSAGAAMAVILGATHPELYAAVGAHSGLPYGAAHDIPSAFDAMKGAGALASIPNLRAAPMARLPQAEHRVPTIVFHGDRDPTVDARNGAAITEQAAVGRPDEPHLRANVHEGTASGGRTYSRTVYTDAANQPVVEQWVLHGAGHAWSGGSPNGSFTDACGPDASAEMIRFFYSQQRAGTA
jgi:poly(hydroxyalkanoate) depolymerase family esterase